MSILRYIPVVVATLGVIACGVVHGYWTDRWVKAAEPTQAAERYADLPLVVSDWDGQPIESKPSQGDEITGWLQRRYRNRKTGETVLIALVCGRPGPVSIHTPDVCYGASGYNVGSPHRVAVPGNSGEFWTADAVKTSATGDTKLRLYWSWNDGSGWLAVDNARQTFPRAPVLHKLYVIRELTTQQSEENEPCLRFVQAFAPVFEQKVVAPHDH
jgi:hypothetical protein